MNLFDYINFYYVGSATIIIWTAIKAIRPKHTFWKKILAVVIGLVLGAGFVAVDYKFSQSDLAESLQRLFLSFSISVFTYDYTIKFVIDFLNSRSQKEKA